MLISENTYIRPRSKWRKTLMSENKRNVSRPCCKSFATCRNFRSATAVPRAVANGRRRISGFFSRETSSILVLSSINTSYIDTLQKKKRQEGITFKFDDVNWITIIKIDRIARWIRETYASYSRNESSSTNSHTCAIPRLLFFHFAIRLKNSPTTFAACLERAPHGRSRYPPSYVWNDHLLVVRFHDARSRPRGILDPDSRPPLTADIFFERSGRSFLHLVLLVFLVGENVSGGHTTGRERDLFLRRYTFTFTSPPRCFLSSVPLSPTSPSRSIRSPRSAYLRDSSCDAVSPPSSQVS